MIFGWLVAWKYVWQGNKFHVHFSNLKKRNNSARKLTIIKQHDVSTTSCHHCQMNELKIMERHIYRYWNWENKLAWKHESIHSGKEFRANGIRLRVQFRSVFCSLSTAFHGSNIRICHGISLWLKFSIKLSGVKPCTSLKCLPMFMLLWRWWRWRQVYPI